MLEEEKSSVLRILDVNFNRLREALRVLEDYVRFSLKKEEELALFLKRARHLLKEEMLPLLNQYQIVRYRDIESDVLFFKRLPSEQQRHHIKDVCLANIQRAKEASRSLEEFSKIIDHSLSLQAQKVRQLVYTIEKKIVLKNE